MTNKEAIAELKAMPIIYPITNGENDRASRLMQARDMAIKALKQESCEDAIGRSDMLDAIGHGTTYTSEELQKIIKALPSVNPQPKTGHWLRTGEVDVFYDLPSYECSKCGQTSLENGDYCPNCGAKMVEPQESEG